MKILLILLFPLFILADTIPSSSVKARNFNGDGTQGIGSILDALKVNFTNTTLPVTGTFWQATQPVSIAAPVAVTGTFYQATQPVSIASPVPVTGNFLTDTQLRMSPVPISGALTDTQLRASPLTVLTGGLTDTQLRATPLNVTVTGAGDATAALQTAGNNTLTAINSKIPSPLSIVSNRLLVDGSGVVQPILGSVTVLNPTTTGLTDAQLRASPVPVSGTVSVSTGALATSANQATEIAKLTSIDSKLTSPLAVTGNFYQATQPVSLATVPLASGAATSAYQASIDATLADIKAKTDNLDVALSTRTKPSDTQLVSGSVTVSGVATEATLSSLNSKVTAVDTGAVVVSSSALPAGASTAALQSTGNSSLSSIDTKTGSRTWTLASSTDSTTVTGTVAISNQTGLTNSELRASAIPVSAASLPLPSGAATSALQSTGNATLSSIDTKLTAPLQIRNLSSSTDSTSSVVTSSALPTGASTLAAQNTGNASLSSIDSKLTAPLQVTGPLTDTQLRATAVPVSLSSTTVSNFPATQAVSGTVTANLGTIAGASTSALQTTGNSSLSSIDTKTPTPTQRTPTFTVTSGTGTITAGAKSVSFYNSGTANATVLGSVLSRGESINIEAPDQDTLAAISYVATGTTLKILEVR